MAFAFTNERNMTMYENMSGPVGFAMHEDRLARAMKNVQVAEAVAARKSRSVTPRGWTYREPIAKALIALAIWLTPGTRTTATTSTV
jgi:hypothetical protein